MSLSLGGDLVVESFGDDKTFSGTLRRAGKIELSRKDSTVSGMTPRRKRLVTLL